MPVSKEQRSLTSCAHGGRWSWQGTSIYFVDIGDFLFLQHLASHSCHSFLPSPLRFCQHSLQTEEPERGFKSAVLAAQWGVPSLLPWPDGCLWHPMHMEGRLEKGWAGIGPSAVDFDLSRAGLLVCE